MGGGIRFVDYDMPRTLVPVADVLRDLAANDPGFVLPRPHASVEDLAAAYVREHGLAAVAIESARTELEVLSELTARMLRETGIDPASVNAIVYCGDEGSIHDGVSVPYHVQASFGMKQAEVIGIAQGCSGTLVALRILDALMATEGMQRAVVLSPYFVRQRSERYVHGALQGDGAGIVLFERGHDRLKLRRSVVRTDGKFSSRVAPRQHQDVIRFLGHTVKGLLALLEASGLTAEQVRWFVPQNGAAHSIEYICNALEWPMERFFTANFGAGGHLGDVDTIRNLADLSRTAALAPGDHLILLAAGIGATFTATHIEV